MAIKRRLTAAMFALVAAIPGCTARQARERELMQACEFSVYNRTPLALEIRIQVHSSAFAPIGSINPGELLTHTWPCAARWIEVRGVAIPWQVGAPTQFAYVGGSVELVDGERTRLSLHWP